MRHRLLRPQQAASDPRSAWQNSLAGKLIALFDRAEARDFADVYVLAQHFDKDILLEQASQIDLGFDPAVLATMMSTLDRFTDDEIPIDNEATADLREFFRQWRQELQAWPTSPSNTSANGNNAS